jgi:hypothetical protein
LAKAIETFGAKASKFFFSLDPDFRLPKDFEFLLPYENAETKRVTEQFFRKYYNDKQKRVFVIGINPGRFGAGTTGIAFTDPINLEMKCGIKNDFAKKPELSSTFIYHMIDKYGGVKKFYADFFLTAICPIGFVKDGKNINYYDDKALIRSSRKFIIESLTQQFALGSTGKVAICLGEGKNLTYLTALNKELQLFDEILPLAHPRFILQYRRKKLDEYTDLYLKTLQLAVQKSV